ncbi:hypothetical protein SBRY_100088 [Actinacidiphila bryophytorum]|uniref:Uncharacterized protein n=1 Tax=Actinacidiphila bryophytorum TaxID=1436133 RepID=A0A9W4ED02_9ACTN|nr:hypothetical protein SBRY_100088 [Actinacidiphila bryophytorum]
MTRSMGWLMVPETFAVVSEISGRPGRCPAVRSHAWMLALTLVPRRLVARAAAVSSVHATSVPGARRR